jgi:hypothetical protein
MSATAGWPQEARRPRHSVGRHRDRRQPQRRPPAPAPDSRQAAMPPIRGKRGRPRRRPDVLCADRGYDHDVYGRQVRELGIRPIIAAAVPSTAAAWARTAGSWKHPSPSCSRSAEYASGGRSALTSTRPSSPSAARSSAGDASGTRHSEAETTPACAIKFGTYAGRRPCMPGNL